jgi:hypothetical protein
MDAALCQTQSVPTIGPSDQFEIAYRPLLSAKLARFGLEVNYQHDLAGLDLGLHLYERRDHSPTTNAILSLVRVWIQAKGIRTDTLSAEQIDKSASIAIEGLPIEQILHWYAAAEPVYLVVYLEAIDAFLAKDIRVIVDSAQGPEELVACQRRRQVSGTLHIPHGATLDLALMQMPSHRSLRIDGPPFRGRPLGHRYDPLRSELQRLDPPLYEEIVNRLLAAHDFRHSEDVPLRDALGPNVGHIKSFLGTLNLTYEWVSPIFTQFGWDRADAFRLEGAVQQVQGKVLVVVHSDPGEEWPTSSDNVRALIDGLRNNGVTRALVFFNESDFELFGAWRSTLYPLTEIPQGLGSIAINVLTTTLVYLDVWDRLTWKYLNLLYPPASST